MRITAVRKNMKDKVNGIMRDKTDSLNHSASQQAEAAKQVISECGFGGCNGTAQTVAQSERETGNEVSLASRNALEELDSCNSQVELDEIFMRAAMDEARRAEELDEVPIGAVAVRDGKIIARGFNTRETAKCATNHAEIICINEACRALGGWRLPGVTLYVTLEPCAMCAGAIINARIPRVVFGAADHRFGALGSLVDLAKIPFNHIPEVSGGVLAEECASLLSEYFRKKRKKNV